MLLCIVSDLTCVLPYTPISRSRHFEIESEAPVGRNPEVTVNHQPGPAATGIYEPRCKTRRHIFLLLLYFTAVGIRGGMSKPISCISERAQQLDRGLKHLC